jgi:hypothetical protein
MLVIRYRGQLRNLIKIGGNLAVLSIFEMFSDCFSFALQIHILLIEL